MEPIKIVSSKFRRGVFFLALFFCLSVYAGGPSPIMGGGGGSSTSLPATNALVVDAGGKGQYTTCAAAIAAMTSGQTLHVMPGTYTEPTITTTKVLNIFCEPGTTLQTGNDHIRLFSDTIDMLISAAAKTGNNIKFTVDTTVGLAVGQSVTVSGTVGNSNNVTANVIVVNDATHFTLVNASGVTQNSETGQAIWTAPQTITITGGGIFQGGSANDFQHGQGTFFIGNPGTVMRVKGIAADSIGTGNGADGCVAEFDIDLGYPTFSWPPIWWGGGEVHATGKVLQNGNGDYNVISGGGASDSDWLYLNYDHVKDGGNGIFNGGSGNIGTNQRISLRAAFIEGAFTNLTQGFIYIVADNKMLGGVDIEGAAVWLTVQKCNEIITCGAGNAELRIHGFDDAGVSTGPYIQVSGGNVKADVMTCTNSQAGMSLFSQSGGNLEIEGGDFTAIAGEAGSLLTGGTCRFNGRMDMSAVASANPISIQTASTPTLILGPNAKLLANGATNTVARDSGSITIISQGAGNTALGTGVTATGSFTVISGLK